MPRVTPEINERQQTACPEAVPTAPPSTVARIVKR